MAYKIKFGDDDFSLVNLSGLPALSGKRECSFSLYEQAKKDNREVHISKRKRCVVAKLTGEKDSFTFVGRSKGFGDSSLQTATTGYKYMIGVRDKKDRTVTLHKASFYHLAPVLCGEDDTAQSDSQQPQTFAAKMNNLTEAFGSERSKKAMASALRNKVDTSTLESSLAPAIQLAEKNIEKDKERLNTEHDAWEDMPAIIPPRDVKAAVPEEVYRLEDLVPLSEMGCLEEVAREALTSNQATLVHDWTTNDRLPVAVVERLSRLACPSPAPPTLDKAQQLFYAACLIWLYLQPSQDLCRHGAYFPEDIPEKIRRCVLKQFTTSGGPGKGGYLCHMSKQQKDRLLNYLLILLLTVDGFSLSFEPLAKELKITNNKMLDHLKYLGCTFAKSDPHSSSKKLDAAVLKIPLAFPKPKKNRAPRS